jgi:hypothetical protein
MDNLTNPNLSISDLQVIKQLIDLACTRGAFKANEMKTIGATYDKLSLFLETIVASAQAEAASTNQEKQDD